MAHKTFVNGTSYDITGGKTLVSGTSYSVQGGKVLVNGTAYDISFILPPAALDLWSGDNSYDEINCIAYGNGYWVVGGAHDTGNNLSYGRIAYATSLDGPWTIKDLWDSTSSYATIKCVTYADGYWVVGGHYLKSTTNSARIAYTTSPDGTWTTKDLWGNSYDSTVECITFADGYWVAGGAYSQVSVYQGTYYGTWSARIAYTTSLGGVWTTKDLWSNTANTDEVINCITCANGYWVVGGRHSLNAYIGYATSPDGTWTNKSLRSYNSTSDKIICLIYANGYWVAGGSTTSGNYYARIVYATSPDGTWTEQKLWNSDSSSANVINEVFYAEGRFVVVGQYRPSTTSDYYGRLAYATSLDGPWTIKDLWSSSPYGNNGNSEINCITYADNYWVLGGRFYHDIAYNARLEYSPTLDGFDEI